jgi:hypothetical protein
MRVPVLAYIFLCAIMLGIKSLGESTTTGNAADLLANVMALGLLQPWISVVIAKASNQDLISLRTLVWPAALNIAILLTCWLIVSRVRAASDKRLLNLSKKRRPVDEKLN